MNIRHNVTDKYYDIEPEKYASFHERSFHEFMYDFCNKLGLEGKEVISIQTLNRTYLAYRLHYEQK